MKTEKLEFTPAEKMIEFYRQHPVEAAEDILGIKLMWLQRVMLRALWFKRFTMINVSRGGSKSFTLEVFSLLKALLYPNIQIGIVTPSYRQVRSFLFPDMIRMIRNSPYLRNCIEGRTTISNERCIIKFKHGSFIEGLPPGNDGKNIRGRRYHVVLVDEYAHTSEDVLKEAIRPMLNVEIFGRENQYHVSSTPYYKWNHMWPQYVHHIQMCIKHPEQYELVEFDYRDVNDTPVSRKMPILPFSISKHIIAMQRADMTDEQFQMENLARFPDDVSTFFSSRLIDFASPRKHPGPVELEYSGNTNSTYYMGIDVARQVDNFAIAIIKEENARRKLIRVRSMNKATYPEMNEMIRRTLLDYPGITKIAIGAGGGGYAIKDLLAEDWFDRETGRSYGKILCLWGEDEKHDLMTGNRLVHLVNESGPLNNFIYTSLKRDMENQVFLFPSPRHYGLDGLSPREEEALQEIIKTQEEFLKLQAIPTAAGHHKFEPPNQKKDRKDRATAVALCNYLMVESMNPLDNSTPAICGIWVPNRGY